MNTHRIDSESLEFGFGREYMYDDSDRAGDRCLTILGSETRIDFPSVWNSTVGMI